MRATCVGAARRLGLRANEELARLPINRTTDAGDDGMSEAPQVWPEGGVATHASHRWMRQRATELLTTAQCEDALRAFKELLGLDKMDVDSETDKMNKYKF